MTYIVSTPCFTIIIQFLLFYYQQLMESVNLLHFCYNLTQLTPISFEIEHSASAPDYPYFSIKAFL